MNEQAKILIIVIFSILFLVCVKVIVTDLPKEIEQKEAIIYKSDTVKTYLYLENMDSPRVDVISSLQELNNYTNKFNTSNLITKLNSYTNLYFKDKSLIIITIQENSGSNSNVVSDIKKIDKSTIDITVNRNIPEIGTTDMAMNHLIIEINKNKLKNIDDILVNSK